MKWNKIVSKSFTSTLNSFSFIGVNEEIGNYYNFNSDNFKCLNQLKISQASILIGNYIFNDISSLTAAIKIFSNSSTVTFSDCFYKDCEDNLEEVKFEGIQTKTIIFTDCSFENRKIIEKAIVNSGIAQNLDKIIFTNMHGSGVDEIKNLMDEYHYETGLNNYEIK